MSIFNKIEKAKYGFLYNNPYAHASDLMDIPLNAGLSYINGFNMTEGMRFKGRNNGELNDPSGKRYQRAMGTIGALNAGLNTAATYLNNRNKKREFQEDFQDMYLDSFLEIPYDRYAYESYSNTPYYAQDGGYIKLEYGDESEENKTNLEEFEKGGKVKNEIISPFKYGGLIGPSPNYMPYHMNFTNTNPSTNRGNHHLWNKADNRKAKPGKETGEMEKAFKALYQDGGEVFQKGGKTPTKKSYNELKNWWNNLTDAQREQIFMSGKGKNYEAFQSYNLGKNKYEPKYSTDEVPTVTTKNPNSNKEIFNSITTPQTTAPERYVDSFENPIANAVRDGRDKFMKSSLDFAYNSMSIPRAVVFETIDAYQNEKIPDYYRASGMKEFIEGKSNSNEQRKPSNTVLKNTHPYLQEIGDAVLDPNIIGSASKGLYNLGRKAGKNNFKLMSNTKGTLDDFKSEIDWSKWNKEIPENKALMDEYNAIEQQAKTNGTWMKNPDGSKFKGTPEQFVQQNSNNFKRAFSESKLLNPDGSPTIQYHGTSKVFNTFDPQKFQLGDSGYSGVGIYTSPSKSTAKSYALSSAKFHTGEITPTVLELYGLGKNPARTHELPEGYDLFNFHRSKNYAGDVPIKEQLRDYDVAIRTQRGGTRIAPDYDSYENVFPTNLQLKSARGNNGMFDMTNPNIYKTLAPITIGAAGYSQLPSRKQGGQIPTSKLGLWEYPNQTVRVPSNNITMQNIPGNVLALPNSDKPIIMQPGRNYKFPNSSEVIEVPLYQDGGQVWDSTFDKENNNMVDWDASFEEIREMEVDTSDDFYNEVYELTLEDKLEMLGEQDYEVDSSEEEIGYKIKQGLLDRGFTNDEALAIVGNIAVESAGFQDRIYGDLNLDTPSFGLMQWRKSRLDKLRQKYGNNPSLENQLDYIQWELQGGNPYETKQFNKAMKGKSIADKTYLFAKYVERPSENALFASRNKRITNALKYK